MPDDASLLPTDPSQPVEAAADSARSVSAPRSRTSSQRYTAAQVIDAIRESRGLVTAAARKLNCDPDTVRNYARRYPTVAAAIQEAREATTDTAESALYDAILERQPWAVTFYLKTQGRNRGYGDRVELAGDAAQPVRIRLVWPEERDADAGD